MLPDFGWTELLVISIVLIVVIGPKDLPKVLRGFGRTMTSVRRMAGDFRKQFDDALREAELDDVRRLADDVRSLDPRRQIKDALDPLAEAGREIDADMKKAMGDTRLPELPKSPPQAGLDAAGAKARAAQATGRKGGASLKPAAASAKTQGDKTQGDRTQGAKTKAAKTKATKTKATKTRAAKTKTDDAGDAPDTGAAPRAKPETRAPAKAKPKAAAGGRKAAARPAAHRKPAKAGTAAEGEGQ